MNKIKEEWDAIFEEKILEYNKNNRYYGHFVKISEDSIMYIKWSGESDKDYGWNYEIYPLEQMSGVKT